MVSEFSPSGPDTAFGHYPTVAQQDDIADARSASRTIAVIDLGDFACQPSARFGHEPYGMRPLAGLRVFERMANRLADCDAIDDIYLVGSNVPPHLIRGCQPAIKTCLLSSVHVTERLAYAVDAADAQWCVYLPANRPFVDPAMISRLLDCTSDTDCDFIGYRGDCGIAHAQTLGLAGEVFHCDAIRRLRRQRGDMGLSADLSIVSHLHEASGAFHLNFVPLPKEVDQQGLHFSIQCDQDWDEAQSMCRTLVGGAYGYHELVDAARLC